LSKPDIVIDKVKWDGTKVRLEFQRLRKDLKYDEAMIGSTDQPLPSFRAALVDLVQDVCAIVECPTSYGDKMVIRGVTFTDSDGTRGACITALKSVKTAKAPLVLNTPHLTFGPMNDGDSGPFLPGETIERLETLEAEAIRYINGEREQAALPLEPAPVVPVNSDAFAQAITDPKSPAVQEFARRMKAISREGCSLTIGGRTLSMNADGDITAGSDTTQPTEGEL
jgi:hypothetical protein